MEGKKSCVFAHLGKRETVIRPLRRLKCKRVGRQPRRSALRLTHPLPRILRHPHGRRTHQYVRSRDPTHARLFLSPRRRDTTPPLGKGAPASPSGPEAPRRATKLGNRSTPGWDPSRRSPLPLPAPPPRPPQRRSQELPGAPGRRACCPLGGSVAPWPILVCTRILRRSDPCRPRSRIPRTSFPGKLGNFWAYGRIGEEWGGRLSLPNIPRRRVKFPFSFSELSSETAVVQHNQGFCCREVCLHW